MRLINYLTSGEFTFEVFEFNTCRIIRACFDEKIVLFRDTKKQYTVSCSNGQRIMDELKETYLAYTYIGDDVYVNTELLETVAIRVDFGDYAMDEKPLHIEEVK